MKKNSFIRSLVFMLATAAALLFAMGAEVSCGDNLAQSEHTCLTSIGESIKQLRHDNKSKPHDIEAEMINWQTDYPAGAPFVKEYVMTYDYTLAENATITLGQNVWVSVCTYSAELNVKDSQIVLSKDENGVVNSGFLIHDCLYHGCFAAVDAAMKLSETRVQMAYRYALKNGNTPYVFPAGSYALTEYFDFSSYIENGQITFEAPYKTSVCFNNLLVSPTDPEVLALRNRGVTVHLECIEGTSAPATHACAYTQNVTPFALTQESFDSIVADLKTKPTPASDENPLQKFFYAFLTEDISCNEKLAIPDGMYYGVCKNGFAFDVPSLENVYVFDCEPHVCLHTGLTDTVPLWQDGLDLLSAHAAAANVDFVLPNGAYALMEDVNFTTFPKFLSATGTYEICQNGHNATGLTLPENDGCSFMDCTQSLEDVGLLTHSCTEIHNHITPLLITDAVLSQLIGSDGSFKLPQGASELALALPMDFEIDSTIVIPKGLTLYLCLNGHTLSGSASLIQDANSSYMFKVEYGAEFHVCDCSAKKTGALLSVTVDMLLGQQNNPPNWSSSPVYNLGITELHGVTLQGLTGFYNAGQLIANDSSITGGYTGIMVNQADAYNEPLHSAKPSVTVNNCTINSVVASVMKLGGDVTLTDVTLNATGFAIISDYDLLNLNAEEYRGELVLDGVTINLTSVIPEFDAEALMIIQELGMLSAIVADAPMRVNGDLSINVEEWLLAPYIKDNTLKEMRIAEFIIGENTYLDVADGVTLTDTYRAYILNPLNNELVLSNANLSENFILMQGLSSMLKDGEFVVLPPSESGFADNAVVTEVSVGFDGYVSLNLYCKFDSVATEESFLNNPNSKVLFNIAGEEINLRPNEMQPLGNNRYVYRVNFYPKDYQDKIYAQFTNGQYTWTGTMAISVADFLETTLLSMEQSLSEVEEVLNNSTATETDVAAAKENKKQLTAIHNVVLGMLNYCGATTKYFYQTNYEPLDSAFAHQEVEITVDENTQETLEQTVWVQTSVADAMAAVTADTLKEYAPQVKEGSVLPSNVQFIGASLILNSGTFIRFYFTAKQDVLQGLTVTINGKKISPTLYNKADNIYYVEVENLSALKLKTMYEMTIADGESEYTVSYGVFSYMYGVLNNPESSEALVLIAKATWLYADEAEKTIQILSKMEADDGEEVESNDEA